MIQYNPGLAVATGVFEFLAAGVVFFSPGRKRFLYPVGIILLILAGYQFAEVAVCANPQNHLYARLAFFEITWLPPLALWLIYQLSSAKNKWLMILPAMYFVTGLALLLWIFVDPSCITKSVCELVIARYIHPSPFDLFYGIYFQSGLVLLVLWASAAMVHAADLVIRKHLANLQTGVLGVIFQSMAVRILMPESAGILPSVMCHFALILAVSLCFFIARERKNLTSHTNT